MTQCDTGLSVERCEESIQICSHFILLTCLLVWEIYVFFWEIINWVYL
jgi:hypothetical protein